jgi:hypothetical protein
MAPRALTGRLEARSLKEVPVTLYPLAAEPRRHRHGSPDWSRVVREAYYVKYQGNENLAICGTFVRLYRPVQPGAAPRPRCRGWSGRRLAPPRYRSRSHRGSSSSGIGDLSAAPYPPGGRRPGGAVTPPARGGLCGRPGECETGCRTSRSCPRCRSPVRRARADRDGRFGYLGESGRRRLRPGW